MLRYPRFLTSLLLLVPFLLGASPYQQASGFTWQWWYWLCLIGLLVVGLLVFISMLAGRQAPPPEVQPEKYAPTLSHTPAPPPSTPAGEPEHSAPPEAVTTAAPDPEPTVEPEPVAAADSLAAPTPASEPEPIAEPVSFAPEPEAADDLTRIEGIGPKISELLQAAGIRTFAGLAAASPDQLKEILEAAGPQFRLADPISWPQQAGLAAAGDWDSLQTLQDNLKGGRDVG